MDRDTDFTAYLEARQARLLRTAYLLTGDQHQAEDLLQTSLAKLTSRGTGCGTAARWTPTCAGSWSTRTTRCGGGRGSGARPPTRRSRTPCR